MWVVWLKQNPSHGKANIQQVSVYGQGHITDEKLYCY